MQLTMFMGTEKFEIKKPVRLIELFAGYGSQAFALEYLGVDFESWKICEWAVKSIQAYKDAHCADDNTDYSKNLTDEQVLDYLTSKGISADYNKPMTREQIKRLGVQKQRQIFNNIFATCNLVNIQQVHAWDLDIVDTDKYCYVMTYSFPCQDLSKAGLGKGMEKGSGTRSGMLWEVERILDECEKLPQVLLMENVPDVIGANNIKHFADWLAKLESLGYKCFWQVLNGKDYGVPQNRERCFMVSILGDYCYEFPEPIKLEKRLKDLLEDEVDEKFYLSDRAISGIQNTTFNCSTLEARTEKDGVMPTLCARDYKDPKLVVEEPKVLAGIGEKKSNGGTQWYQQDRIYDDNIAISVTTSFNPYYATEKKEKLGYAEKNILKAIQKNGDKMPPYIDIYNSRPINDEVSSTLTTNSGFAQCGITLVCEQNKKENLKTKLCNDLIESGLLKENYVINHSYTNGGNCKNRNSRQSLEDYIETTDNTMPTLTTRSDCLGVVKNYRIRKLTPKECGRLQGLKDVDINKIQRNQSNASCYHLYGDAIVVPVLMAIFSKMCDLDYKIYLDFGNWWKNEKID